MTQFDAIPLYKGLSVLAGDYDGFILDLWGVIHDGVHVFPGVVNCLEKIRQADKKVVMLSNAPRLSSVIEEQLTGFGVPRALYEGVISSGQEAFDLLASRNDPWYAVLGSRCYHIGPARDRHMVEGLSMEEVEDVAAADFILNTGPWGDEETVADYEAVLSRGAASGVKMICCNPDIEVIRGGLRMICAGALALRYEELGGEVRYHGKPYPSIYTGCFERLGLGQGKAEKSRILAIGDSLRTDIAGAGAAGLDSLLVLSGIHGDELGAGAGEVPDFQRLEELLTPPPGLAPARPKGLLAELVW